MLCYGTLDYLSIMHKNISSWYSFVLCNIKQSISKTLPTDVYCLYNKAHCLNSACWNYCMFRTIRTYVYGEVYTTYICSILLPIICCCWYFSSSSTSRFCIVLFPGYSKQYVAAICVPDIMYIYTLTQCYNNIPNLNDILFPYTYVQINNLTIRLKHNATEPNCKIILYSVILLFLNHFKYNYNSCQTVMRLIT